MKTTLPTAALIAALFAIAFPAASASANDTGSPNELQTQTTAALTPEQHVRRIFASLNAFHDLQPTWRRAKMPAASWANKQFDKRASAAINAMPDTLNYTGGLVLYLGGLAAVNRGDLDRAALSFEAGYALGCLVCGAALATVLDLDPSRLKPEPALAQDWNDLAAHAGVSSAAGALLDVEPRTYERLISGNGATMPTTTGSKNAAAIFARAYSLGDKRALSIVDRAKAGEARATGILQKAGVDIAALPETTSNIVNRLGAATSAETSAQRSQDIEALTVRAEGGDPTALLALGTRRFADAAIAFSTKDSSDLLIEAAVRGNPMSMAAFADSVLQSSESPGYRNEDAAIFAFAAWVITPAGDPAESLFRGILDELKEKLDPKPRKAFETWFREQAKALEHRYP